MNEKILNSFFEGKIMSTIINFKCSNCNFEFQDRDLIFYIDKDNNLKIESLSLEVSKTMSKSPLSGFLYENCCPNCNQLIRTFVVETDDTQLTSAEIEENLYEFIEKERENNLDKNNIKLLFFDFKNTFYKERRSVLENNTCPNCENAMSLVISEKIPCPECGGKLEETYR